MPRPSKLGDRTDQDLHHGPPPSAQRVSWTAAAGVRLARGKPGFTHAVPSRYVPTPDSRSVASGTNSLVATAIPSTFPATLNTDPACQCQNRGTSSSSSSKRYSDNHHASSHSHAPSSSSFAKKSALSTIARQFTPPSNPESSNVHASLSPSSAVASPATRTFFDPWNSSSTGHQRAENRLSGSTSWRDSRNLKLGEQYRGGLSGGVKRVADTVGAGRKEFGKDGRKANGGWERGASGLRTGGQKSLMEVWGATKASNVESRCDKSMLEDATHSNATTLQSELDEIPEDLNPNLISDENTPNLEAVLEQQPPLPKQIFDNLCFYLNGSTMPLVSDHKLKHLIASHGGRWSISLGRRSVTHVILGTANNGQGGCGGGLAGSKIQKEIARTRGKGVKFVSVDWVLESIKADRRLPEARFSVTKLAPPNQNSVYGMLRNAG